MMIVDKTTQVSRTTTLNEIPNEQVFRGTIVSPKSSWGPEVRTTGTFMKVCGSVGFYSGRNREATPPMIKPDVVVVSLKSIPNDFTVFLWCREVLNYEPLDVELIVKGVQK